MPRLLRASRGQVIALPAKSTALAVHEQQASALIDRIEGLALELQRARAPGAAS
jgi:hypothetical protein